MKARSRLREVRRRGSRFAQLQYARLAVWTRRSGPDFMCIGAPRAATTWLYHRLRAHPDFYLPKIKELRFFDERKRFDYVDGSGLEWDESFFFDLAQPAHWRWYWLQFRAGQGRIKGEITPAYCALGAERVRTIRDVFPELKVVHIIRSPIDVVWSTVRKVAWYQRGNGALQQLPCEVLRRAALHPANLRWGHFDRNIESWRASFPEQQMLHLFFEDVEEDSLRELNRVCDFLGGGRVGGERSLGVSARINQAPSQDMPEAVRDDLRREFRPTVAYLERRFGRDLSHWLS